jgi:hypothetical protein
LAQSATQSILSQFPTEVRTMNRKFICRFLYHSCALSLALCFSASSLFAQRSTSTDDNSPALTLTPAVIMVKAKPGQTFSQDLTLWNNTIDELTFHMEAEDIVVKDGRRVFVPAGELEGGIARYAVFTDNDVIAMPGSFVSTRVTVTVPQSPNPRAIACIFRGNTLIGSGAVTMTASLGSLVTFTLGNDFKVQNQPLKTAVDTDAKMVTFSEDIKNSGGDPIVPKGVLAIMNESGALVTKLPITGPRLLPGESARLTAEHPGLPKPGNYTVKFLLENENAVFSNSAEFTVK